MKDRDDKVVGNEDPHDRGFIHNQVDRTFKISFVKEAARRKRN